MIIFSHFNKQLNVEYAQIPIVAEQKRISTRAAHSIFFEVITLQKNCARWFPKKIFSAFFDCAANRKQSFLILKMFTYTLTKVNKTIYFWSFFLTIINRQTSTLSNYIRRFYLKMYKNKSFYDETLR